MNYFSKKTAAARYTKGRPDFHENTIERIRSFLSLEEKIGKALDVACGTGLSTVPLLHIAEEVYGTDSSQEMLDHAAIRDNIRYALAPAERQPFADGEFDLITVSSGIHWFNIDAFLKESYRLLKPHGWLIVYDNFFLGEMKDHPDFMDWYHHLYQQKFPAPARNDRYDWTDTNLSSKGFLLLKLDEFKNTVDFSGEQLLNYFTTQSNVIAAVGRGETTYEDVEVWLEKEFREFFLHEEDSRQIFYGNWIKYLQKF